MRYPSERLYEEVAYLAYYLHWPYEQIMHMEHRERQQWVRRGGPHQYAVKRAPGATRVSTGRTAPRGSPPEVSLCHPTGHRGSGSDPYLAFNFVVEIEGLIVGGFSQVHRPAKRDPGDAVSRRGPQRL